MKVAITGNTLKAQDFSRLGEVCYAIHQVLHILNDSQGTLDKVIPQDRKAIEFKNRLQSLMYTGSDSLYTLGMEIQAVKDRLGKEIGAL